MSDYEYTSLVITNVDGRCLTSYMSESYYTIPIGLLNQGETREENVLSVMNEVLECPEQVPTYVGTYILDRQCIHVYHITYAGEVVFDPWYWEDMGSLPPVTPLSHLSLNAFNMGFLW